MEHAAAGDATQNSVSICRGTFWKDLKWGYNPSPILFASNQSAGSGTANQAQSNRDQVQPRRSNAHASPIREIRCAAELASGSYCACDCVCADVRRNPGGAGASVDRASQLQWRWGWGQSQCWLDDG